MKWVDGTTLLRCGKWYCREHNNCNRAVCCLLCGLLFKYRYCTRTARPPARPNRLDDIMYLHMFISTQREVCIMRIFLSIHVATYHIFSGRNSKASLKIIQTRSFLINFNVTAQDEMMLHLHASRCCFFFILYPYFFLPSINLLYSLY